MLSDPKKREIYDQGGEEAIKGGSSGGGFDFHSPMDIFDMFFGGRRSQRGSARRGKDVVHQMKVSLEDLYNGATRKLALQKNVICAKCEGIYCLKWINILKCSKIASFWCEQGSYSTDGSTIYIRQSSFVASLVHGQG